jgi:predicted nucleic acid-binding protein
MPVNDSWIAPTAPANDASVASRDSDDEVPGLQVLKL